VNHFAYADASPHSPTVRITYTVPAGKKAMVELLSCRVNRVTAATTLGSAQAWWALTPSGGTEKYLLMASLRTNNVGDNREHGIGATLIMLAGDALKGYTCDTSTGGTCDYFLSLKITEFDA
jgi:hypothetical protein